jgi:hypothetical protein
MEHTARLRLEPPLSEDDLRRLAEIPEGEVAVRKLSRR